MYAIINNAVAISIYLQKAFVHLSLFQLKFCTEKVVPSEDDRTTAAAEMNVGFTLGALMIPYCCRALATLSTTHSLSHWII